MERNYQNADLNLKIESVFNKVLLNNSDEFIKDLGDLFKELSELNNFSEINFDYLLPLFLLIEEKQLNSTIFNILYNNVKNKVLYTAMFPSSKNENICQKNNSLSYKYYKRFEYENDKKFVISYKLYEDNTEEIISKEEVLKPNENTLEELFSGFLKEEIDKEQEKE